MKTIRSRLMLAFLSFTLVPVLLIGILSFFTGVNALKKAQMSSLEAVSKMKANKLETFFRERIRDIQAAQDDFNIRTHLPILNRFADDRKAPAYLQSKEKLDGQLKTLQAVNGYADVMLVSPEGKIVYATYEEHSRMELGKPLPDPDDLTFEKGRQGIYFSTPFLNPRLERRPSMLIAAPAHDFSDRFIGVIVFEIEMSPIYHLIEDRTGLGETGETLIGKKTEGNILFLSSLLHEQSPFLSKVIPLEKGIALPMQEAVQGREGAGLSLDYRPKEVAAAWRFIPVVGWGMVVKIDTDEAVTSIVSLREKTILISLLFLLVGGVLAVLIAHSISKPIRTLQAGVNIVGSGRLDHHMGSVAEDEIGQLSRDFDRMAANLRRITASRDELNQEIDQRKRAEADLLALNLSLEEQVAERTQLAEARSAALERVNEELTDFTSIASHDLQEPLRKVISFGDLLKKKYSGSLEGKGILYLERMQEATRRMQRLIDDLLSLSRVATWAQPFETIDLKVLIQEVLDDLDTTIERTKGRVEVGVLPALEGDRTQIYQLFLNLIGNGLKYHPADRPPVVKVGAMPRENHMIEIRIRDNGIGFDERYLDRIFKPFQRLHGSDTFMGTGMGLAICDKIVQRHGGRITAESTPGQGATFIVQLPMASRKITEAGRGPV